MNSRRPSTSPRINAAPRLRAGGLFARGRGRPHRRRQPWIFGPSWSWPEPYVFTRPAAPDGAGVGAAEPADPQPDAAADANAADGVAEPAAGGGDGAPADNEDYDKRRPPKRPPSPRGVVGVSTSLEWQRCKLMHYPIPALPFRATSVPDGSVPNGGGVYIVVRDKVPIYVGETGSFRERWNARLLEAYQAGIIDTTLDRPVELWCGVSKKGLTREARRTVESAIIRVLINGQVGGKLRQGTSFNEIRPSAQIDVVQVLPEGIKLAGFRKGMSADARKAVEQVKGSDQIPKHLHNQLTLPPNSVFEAEFYEVAAGP